MSFTASQGRDRACRPPGSHAAWGDKPAMGRAHRAARSELEKPQYHQPGPEEMADGGSAAGRDGRSPQGSRLGWRPRDLLL